MGKLSLFEGGDVCIDYKKLVICKLFVFLKWNEWEKVEVGVSIYVLLFGVLIY